MFHVTGVGEITTISSEDSDGRGEMGVGGFLLQKFHRKG